jgi:hypothetical protein
MLDDSFHHGIPTEIRKSVWNLVIPNNLKITDKLYKFLLEKAKIAIGNPDKDINF